MAFKLNNGQVRWVRFALCLIILLVFASPIFSIASAARTGQATQLARLKKLYDQKRFFQLRDAVESDGGKAGRKILFYRGAIANIFYQPQVSAGYLNRYISQAAPDDELLTEAYTLLADDFVKLSEYGKAADTYRTILDHFKHALKQDETGDYENSAGLYASLRNVPRETVVLGRENRLNEPSSEPGWNVPVEANNQRVVLGLDTGANISLLAKSVATQLGVKMIDQSISMGSVTSIKVQLKLGFLPAMKIGSTAIQNAIFIVLDDKDLTFPDGFFLKGVIGFPVIAALRRISFNGDGTVSLSGKLERPGRANMCMDGRNILFQGEYENRNLTFMLDTGAERSVLYVPFLHEFEDEVKARYSQRTEKFTGVGGSEELPAYIVKDFAVNLSGKGVRIPEVRLMTKAVNDSSKFYYGNIGQDLIKRFRSMTLDFVSMRVEFQ
jgi:hypothetical protein